MKKLFAAIAIVFGLMVAPVAAQENCTQDFQYEYSRDLLIQYVGQGVFLEGYIAEGAEVHDFLWDVSQSSMVDLTTSLPAGVENALALVKEDGMGGYTMMIFIFGADGCQIDWAEIPVFWEPEPGLMVDWE